MTRIVVVRLQITKLRNRNGNYLSSIIVLAYKIYKKEHSIVFQQVSNVCIW